HRQPHGGPRPAPGAVAGAGECRAARPGSGGRARRRVGPALAPAAGRLRRRGGEKKNTRRPPPGGSYWGRVGAQGGRACRTPASGNATPGPHGGLRGRDRFHNPRVDALGGPAASRCSGYGKLSGDFSTLSSVRSQNAAPEETCARKNDFFRIVVGPS